MVEFAFAVDPCMTHESSSSPDLCFALSRVQSSASLAWLDVFLQAGHRGRTTASFPELYWVFQLSSTSISISSCKGSHLLCCNKCWRSFQREMCFWIWDLVCHFWPGKLPLEQWAWDFSWNLLCLPFWRNSWKEKTCKLSSQRETYWLRVHWGHYLRSVDLWEGTAYLMQPKVSYATDGLFFVVKNGFSMCLWKSKVLLKACCVLAGSCWVSSSSDLL